MVQKVKNELEQTIMEQDLHIDKKPKTTEQQVNKSGDSRKGDKFDKELAEKPYIAQALKQLEYYFSDWNIRKDEYFRQRIQDSVGGWMDLNVFLEFPRFSQICKGEDFPVLCKFVAKNSLVLEANIKKQQVRRRRPYVETDINIVDNRTLYIEGFEKPYDNAERIKEYIELKYGKRVVFVKPYIDLETGGNDNKSRFYGFGFVEFSQECDADEVLASIRKSYNVNWVNKQEVDLEKKEKNDSNNNNIGGCGGCGGMQLQRDFTRLSVWKKEEWEKLKQEYLERQKLAQAAIRKAERLQANKISNQKNSGRILRVHGLFPYPYSHSHSHSQTNTGTSDDIDNVQQMYEAIQKEIARENPVEKITWKPGDVSAYIRFKTAEHAQQVHSYFEQHKVYQTNHTQFVNVSDAQEVEACCREKNPYYIRTRIIKGKEELNYWHSN